MARDAGAIAALNWAAAQLDLPTLADSGYDGAGQGIKTPIKQPSGQVLAPDNQAYNTLHRATRCLGERTADELEDPPKDPHQPEPGGTCQAR